MVTEFDMQIWRANRFLDFSIVPVRIDVYFNCRVYFVKRPSSFYDVLLIK
jgi:hypothetical protein